MAGTEVEKDAADFAAEQEAAFASGGDAALEAMLFDDPRKAGEAAADQDGANGEADGDGDAAAAGGGDGGDKGKAGEGASAEPQTSKAAGEQGATTGSAAAVTTDGAQDSEAEPIGVKLPSGKIIDYSELKTARQRAAEAEGRVNDLQAQLTELRAKVDAQAQQQGARRDPDQAGNADEDPLAGLNPDDFPEPLVKAVKAATDAAKKATERAERAEQQVQTLAQQSQRSTDDERQTLIDQNDDLRRWQSKKGGLWADAVAKDAELRADPEWQDKPPAERFAEVARRVREDNGMPPPPTPGSTSSSSNGTGAAGAKPGTSSGSGASQTAARNGKGASPAPVSSLSDIPGGATPAADPLQSLEEASTAGIAARFENLSAQQIDDYLARFG